MGFICFKQQHYRPAAELFQKALDNLDGRLRDPTMAPDQKGYAEKKAEILYYLGLCDYRVGGNEGLVSAKQRWKEGCAEIYKAVLRYTKRGALNTPAERAKGSTGGTIAYALAQRLTQ